MKLWQKENTRVDELVERFTVGRDKAFDLLLARYDVQGSAAHAAMLRQVGLLTDEEARAIEAGLAVIRDTIEAGTFEIESGVEDVHSQVELLLTRSIGEAGKKIHSGRSRNDQVAVDIKLFLKDAALQVRDGVGQLFELLLDLSERHRDKLLPGYTHLQIAMPSSFGLWFGAYAESLIDDLEMLAAAFQVIDKNPLGSGAGYGSSLPLDRELTTKLLGFRTLHYNVVYAQMSRGKTEKLMAMAMSSIAATLARLSMDCCLYLSQNFNFISFPAELTTGSSIMPHKKNPDVFELVRARCNRIQSLPNELALLQTNLPSGYHRDLQLTKEILFPGIEDLLACLQITHMMLTRIEVKSDILSDERYRYLFTVEAVNKLVNRGLPFREAYKQVGDEVERGAFHFDRSTPLQHTLAGSLGNLRSDAIASEMRRVLGKFGTGG